MELEITKQRETPLLKRTRVSAMVTFENKTPSRLKIKSEIASKLKTDENLVIIRHVYQRYGKREAKVIAHVYKEDKFIEKLEGKGLVGKHKEKVKAKKEEAPAAEAKPVEEKKEDKAPAKEKKEEAAPAEEKK